jgi:hypothetical protein
MHSQKRSIPVSEAVRRLRNCSPSLDWCDKATFLTQFSLAMYRSGHSQAFREVVLTRAVSKYKDMLTKHTEGRKVMYRSKQERESEKQARGGNLQNSNWFSALGYRASITLPASKDDKLVSLVKSRLNAVNVKDILVCADGGQVSCSAVVKSNPFPRSDCNRSDCLMCLQEPSKGGCTKSGACYTISCSRLPCREILEGEVDREGDMLVPMAQYAGETARTPYTRGAGHLALYTGSEAEKKKSFMWRHCQTVHGGVAGPEYGVKDFRMDLVAPFKDPLSRVLREALEIQTLENNDIGWRSLQQDGRKIHCMNSKQEYHQNVIPMNVQIRGNLQNF